LILYKAYPRREAAARAEVGGGHGGRSADGAAPMPRSWIAVLYTLYFILYTRSRIAVPPVTRPGQAAPDRSKL